MDNFSFDVFEKIKPTDRGNWHLYVDAIYKADPHKGNMAAEVLSKLLGVKNQGGFRYRGKTESPDLVVLFSSGEDIYWRDEIDNSLGLYLYYGDNNTPGRDLHKTNLHGNEILRYIFELAASDDVNARRKIPPVLVFSKAGGRDVKFLGLAVPGIKGKPMKDWLTAVWGCTVEGDRFQNYKAFFTILNTSSGSAAETGYGINLAWLNDIENGKAYDSEYAPIEWKKYIKQKKYTPLIARQERRVKNKEEQLPEIEEQRKMLELLHDFFIEKDHGYSFEEFATFVTEGLDNSIVQIDTTRPFKDGGIDAEGQYRIFKNAGNSIYVDFYMQAKCYKSTSPVTVKDMARLIARIKNRQFGIMVTTSYVAQQAYQEILDDGHPIVIINGKDIIDYIYNECEIRTVVQLSEWLRNNYGTDEDKKNSMICTNVEYRDFVSGEELLVAEKR